MGLERVGSLSPLRFMPFFARLVLLVSLAVPAVSQDGFHLYFGHGGNVIVEQPKLPAPDQGMTLECWFRGAKRLRSPVPLLAIETDRKKDKDLGLFKLTLSASNSLNFTLHNATGQSQSVAGLGKWFDGSWHRATATWDGLMMSVYVDGRQLAQKEAKGFAPLATSQHALKIGPVNAAKARRPIRFPGCIGGVRVWDRGLTAAEVTAGGNEIGCIASYALTAREPVDEVRNEVGAGSTAKLTDDLATAGWLRTRSWPPADNAKAASNRGLDFYCYDLAGVVTGSGRHILVEHAKQKRVGVLWQDSQDDGIAVTWIDPTLRSHVTHELTDAVGMRLAGGTTDEVGNVYYLTIQDAQQNRAEGFEVAAVMHKSRFDGTDAIQRALDVSKRGVNIYDFSSGVLRSASLRHSKGTIGVMLPRRMHKSGDGLRHQGAIALTFSAKDLELTHHHGQTSGHSMANLLTVNKKGRFVALDLGDNYPRGVHLHEFDKSKRTSRLVFTFKTQHATRAKGGYPVYDEISGDGRTFYKWSNDNAVYTELGGLVENKRSYTIVFATDQSLDGRVLDNSRAFRGCDDPRNLALVRVVKDFGRAPGGSEIGDALMASLPRKPVVETGGYFDFSGGWHKQRVVGVTWLTRYAAGEGAHAPQLLPREDGNILVLWEKTGGDASLRAMVIEPDGTVVHEEFALPFSTKLNRQDRVLVTSDRTYLLASDRGGERRRGDEQLRLYFLRN
ncbi:MAG: hypothetical protein ACI8UD_001341 [Planctomycetota bacterium]